MVATPHRRSPLRLARYRAPTVADSPDRPDAASWGTQAAAGEGALLLVTHEDRGSAWVLSLSGEADIFTQGLLEDELDTALAMHRVSLVLDVRRLTFCDVSCAQRVLAATRTASATLHGATGEVKRVFELLDADETLPRRNVCSGVDDAWPWTAPTRSHPHHALRRRSAHLPGWGPADTLEVARNEPFRGSSIPEPGVVMSTIPSERVAETFVEVADTLVDDFDLVDFLTMVTERAAELAGASAAGLLLGDERGQLRFMAASHESARLLELLQLEGGQGPCLECFRSGRPVSHDDLESAADVWPLFSAEAVRLGFRSVQAFPLRHHLTVIGALNTFGPVAQRLDPERVRVVQALADLAAIGILQERAIRHGELLAEQLQHALNSRVTIEQAKGALAHIRSVDTDAAFSLMRNHARQNHKRLVDVALAVLEDPTGIPELTKR